LDCAQQDWLRTLGQLIARPSFDTDANDKNRDARATTICYSTARAAKHWIPEPLTVNCRNGFGQRSEPAHMREERELQSMGNRDARGREKKKPKKTVVKPLAQPPRPATVYKPVPPPPPAPEKSNP
jgi:hypothetical protein